MATNIHDLESLINNPQNIDEKNLGTLLANINVLGNESVCREIYGYLLECSKRGNNLSANFQHDVCNKFKDMCANQETRRCMDNIYRHMMS